MIKERAVELRAFIESMAANIDDSQALSFPEVFPNWSVGTAYKKDDRVRYNGILYKVLQDHTSQSDWTPDVAVSLFVRVSEEEWPEWTQPTGAQDAYMTGDKVAHLDQHWISAIDNNVWEPSVYGWDAI